MLTDTTVNSSLNASNAYLANTVRISSSIPVTPLNDSLDVQYSVIYSLDIDSDTLVSSTTTLDFYSLFFRMKIF